MAFLMIPAVPFLFVSSIYTVHKAAKKAAKRPGKFFTGEMFDPKEYEPVDCVPGVWDTEWSPCSAPCEGGVKTLKRRGDALAKNGGGHCPEDTIYANCNMQSCPVDCQPSEIYHIPELPSYKLDWEGRLDGWSECSSDQCDVPGKQYRYRDTSYDIPGTEDGWPCLNPKESQECVTPCPFAEDHISVLKNVDSGNGNILRNRFFGVPSRIVFANPSDSTDKRLVWMYRANALSSFEQGFELTQRGDGKYVGPTWSFPELADEFGKGSNRTIVFSHEIYIDIRDNTQTELIVVEFVPTIQDIQLGIQTEIVKYKRTLP